MSKMRGHQGQASQSLLPGESHRTHLIPSVVGRDDMGETPMRQAHERLEASIEGW